MTTVARVGESSSPKDSVTMEETNGVSLNDWNNQAVLLSS